MASYPRRRGERPELDFITMGRMAKAAIIGPATKPKRSACGHPPIRNPTSPQMMTERIPMTTILKVLRPPN